MRFLWLGFLILNMTIVNFCENYCNFVKHFRAQNQNQLTIWFKGMSFNLRNLSIRGMIVDSPILAEPKALLLKTSH
jgi:hypothetical protein